jgi:hypothetical protein
MRDYIIDEGNPKHLTFWKEYGKIGFLPNGQMQFRARVSRARFCARHKS